MRDDMQITRIEPGLYDVETSNGCFQINHGSYIDQSEWVVTGPLGVETSYHRSKREAVEAIRETVFGVNEGIAR